MFNFVSEKKNEKIYKFVYNSGSSWDNNKTMLLTACTPVQAVKKFNSMSKNQVFNIVEFTEVIHKNKENKE